MYLLKEKAFSPFTVLITGVIFTEEKYFSVTGNKLSYSIERGKIRSSKNIHLQLLMRKLTNFL